MGKDEGESQQRQTSCWGSVIDLPTRMKRQMKFSTRGWQKSHNC